MKKKSILVLLIFVNIISITYAQTSKQEETEVIYSGPVGISKPLSELAESEEIEIDANTEFHESKDGDKRSAQKFEFTADDGPAYGNDVSTIQKQKGNRTALTILNNWAGQNGGGSCPPDPTGAAGPNHYVQAVNASPFKVFNKTTGSNLSVRQIGALWSPATSNDGDPIVLYDKYADRWFVSQFGTSGNKVYIAISTTNDPTGSYYTYTFTSNQFPDYLKFSIWADGYYMTSNQGTSRVFVFERDKMLLGQTARSVSKTFSPGSVSNFFCPLTADADGVLPPVGTPCPFFWYTENSWGGSAVDAIKYINATVNWTPATPTLTFSTTSTINVAAFDGTYSGNWLDIYQSDNVGGNRLDGIGGVVWYRAQWRKWTGYNTVVLCWGVKISSTQRSIKWVELRQNQQTGNWSLYQEGIYAPDALNRWVGSMAMDDYGSIALCYAVAGPTPATPVSLAFTGRLATDPLGQMTFDETIAKAGTGVMTGCGGRFGDYSHTALDPNGTTFWHTGEFSNAGGPATRIYSFNIPSPASINEAKSDVILNVVQKGNSIYVNAENLSMTGNYVVDIFDVQGRKIDGLEVNAIDNKITTSIDVHNFAKGIYMVRIGKFNTSFQKVVKVPIN
jgi:hypothetical protein